MTAPQTNATIHLSSDRLTAAVVHLWLHSALHDCTELVDSDSGMTQLVTVRPVSLLSSGERVLWQALHILSLREGFDGAWEAILTDHPDLDVPNRAALATAINMWEAAS